jgi:hypothetical protein
MAHLPLSLHHDAEVVAAYAFDWPGETAERPPAASLDPMRISYVRIEERAVPTWIFAYYRQRMKDPRLWPLPAGVWLDSLENDAKTATLRSTDIFITRAAESGPALTVSKEQKQDLIVEILSIEGHDPAKKPDAP